ncbi:MAG: ATP-binding protein, partial [Dehalococcoidales bacterium]|nr:ATP-binding protein [Dehalococcoidales bacterium]
TKRHIDLSAEPEETLRAMTNTPKTIPVRYHRKKDGTVFPVEQMQEQLFMQDRLASIGQLVSGVAHELNNPLTSVIGFSQLLLQQELPKDISEDLKIINHEAQRTSKIVKNLLTFARQQPREKRPVAINEPIQTVLQLRAHEHAVNNIKVNTQFAPDLPRIMGNSSQLQQVFFNIITNAEFAMIEAHHSGALTIKTEQLSGFVRASFSDDGPGISSEHMARLFTPFFTTKEIGKGTGLGLSICQGIVTEHGGRIRAESSPGHGATFIIELPVFKPE